MNELSVEIKTEQLSKLKVVWRMGGAAELPYYVSRVQIEQIGNELRHILERLVTTAVNNGVKHTWKELKELAGKGKELYYELFNDAGGSQVNPDDIRAWIPSLGACRITFNIADYLHIPWGLAFDGDETKLPCSEGDLNVKFYGDFWGLKYRTASLYYRIPPRGLTTLRPGNSLRPLHTLNADCLLAARAHLSDEQEIFLQKLIPAPIHTSSDFWQMWDKQKGEFDFLHFYCHANGSSLLIAKGDQITVRNLQQKLKRASPDAPCLVFLNGCHTAAGDNSGNFLEATGRSGFCGFVGTETQVPDVFALRFGLALHDHLLYDGLELHEILDRLRRDHWPLSVAYSLCAFGGFRISPPMQGPRLRPPGDASINFSTLQLGTGMV